MTRNVRTYRPLLPGRPRPGTRSRRPVDPAGHPRPSSPAPKGSPTFDGPPSGGITPKTLSQPACASSKTPAWIDRRRTGSLVLRLGGLVPPWTPGRSRPRARHRRGSAGGGYGTPGAGPRPANRCTPSICSAPPSGPSTSPPTTTNQRAGTSGSTALTTWPTATATAGRSPQKPRRHRLTSRSPRPPKPWRAFIFYAGSESFKHRHHRRNRAAVQRFRQLISDQWPPSYTPSSRGIDGHIRHTFRTAFSVCG